MHINANGIQINYELSTRPGAPTVMLSHSLCSTMAMWEPQMKTLLPHFTVLRYDTRGHGGSDAPKEDYSLDQLVADAVGLLDALGIKPLVPQEDRTVGGGQHVGFRGLGYRSPRKLFARGCVYPTEDHSAIEIRGPPGYCLHNTV